MIVHSTKLTITIIQNTINFIIIIIMIYLRDVFRTSTSLRLKYCKAVENKRIRDYSLKKR